MRDRLANWLYRALSSEWCGNHSVPADNLVLRTGPAEHGEPIHVARVGEDAFTLWLGYPDHWTHSLGRDEARRLAWFILWTWWIKGEWCGLRRRIWYWALRVRCERYRAAEKT